MLTEDVTADVEGGASSAPAPVSMKELLANRGVFIGCMIFLLQQFSGVNSVVYFSSSVFAKARLISSHSRVPSVKPQCSKQYEGMVDEQYPQKCLL